MRYGKRTDRLSSIVTEDNFSTLLFMRHCESFCSSTQLPDDDTHNPTPPFDLKRRLK